VGVNKKTKTSAKALVFVWFFGRKGDSFLIWYDYTYMLETFVVREEEMPDLAERVLQILEEHKPPKAAVLFLEGDLGAGKTTFTKELASILGINKEEVHSPTFILKKEYITENSVFKKLVHVDAYRFLTKEEGKILHLEDDIEKPEAIIAVEWPSKMKAFSPTITLTFSVLEDDTREVVLAY
jgi:tRNA threonylcarbamoyladenosine biosynthesis protein TsaE